MNEKEPTKKGQTFTDEVADMLMEAFDTQSSDEELRKLVDRGDFSNKDFDWLVYWTRVPPEERRALDGSDRQHKMRVKRTIIKATATLTWAHYFMDVFSDDEWDQIMPSMVLSKMAYISALRGGYENALAVATGLDAGLNLRLQAETSGTLKSEVRVSIVPSAENLMKVTSELGKRLISRIQDQARVVEEIAEDDKGEKKL